MVTKVITFITVILFIAFAAIRAEIKGTIKLTNASGEPGTRVSVPVLVSTDSTVGLGQFTVEYNKAVLHFSQVEKGSDLPAGFSISNVNQNLPFEPTTPGTDENVLVQVSGGGSKSFSGDDQEIIILYFNVVGGSGDTSPLAFDRGGNKTYLATIHLYDIAGDEVNFGNATFNAIVSVELAFFRVFNREAQVHLEWRAETDLSSLGFEIERKCSHTTGPFQKIGYICRATAPHLYSFVDANIGCGTFDYRLKQIDASGDYHYSEIKRISVPVPMSYELLQNFPNPFNSETCIQYRIGREIAEDFKVSIEIYNARGELVRILVAQEQMPGPQAILWNGRDDSGSQVSSGIYFLRLTAGHQVFQNRMILLR